MTTDWTAEKLSFYQDLEAEGFAVSVRVPGSPGVFNPDTLLYVGAVAAVDTATYGIRRNYKIKDVDGTIIQQNDSMLIVPAYGLDAEIATSTEILINSVVQNIINVKKFNPGNVTLGYALQVRL